MFPELSTSLSLIDCAWSAIPEKQINKVSGVFIINKFLMVKKYDRIERKIEKRREAESFIEL
jgi:hypothetical protein